MSGDTSTWPYSIREDFGRRAASESERRVSVTACVCRSGSEEALQLAASQILPARKAKLPAIRKIPTKNSHRARAPSRAIFMQEQSAIGEVRRAIAKANRYCSEELAFTAKPKISN